ncbi:MAG TPA: hypothetical protein VN643_19585 [Pyrinomonadaceae bacterium]|nr:hypothetical protein [Pyrinomonadaceae bacterium]
MKEFTFERPARAPDAVGALATHPGAMFLAGGTTLVDLMKVNVLTWRISPHAKPSQRSIEMEPPSFGAARPISDRALTP